MAGVFDSIEHHLLVEMVSQKLADKYLIRYLSRRLKAEVSIDGEFKASEEGPPQGSMRASRRGHEWYIAVSG